MSYIKKRMYTLVERTGGLAAWEASTKAQKETLLSTLFNRYPYTLCMALFKFESETWNFENIWHGEEEKHLKWQHFWRRLFVTLAIAAFNLDVRPIMIDKQLPKAQRRDQRKIRRDEDAMFLVWKVCRRNSEFLALNMGTIAEIPSRAHRSVGIGRKRKPSSE